MTPRMAISAISLLAAMPCLAGEKREPVDAWLIGSWHVTVDTDADVIGQALAFLPDGTVVVYDADCDPITVPRELVYQVDHNEIRITNTLAGKDFPARTLQSSPDKQRLVLDWPDAGGPAIFERIPADACVKQS